MPIATLVSKRDPIPKNILMNLYIENRKSTREIADILGCSKSRVLRNLRKYAIPRRHEAWNKVAILLEQEIKQCSKCGRMLPLTEFGWTDRSGFRAQCNKCRQEYNRIYREKNKDRLKKYNRKDRDRKYREMNREKIRRKQKLYRAMKREELARKQREYGKTAKSIHWKLRNGASRRQILFNIPLEAFKIWYNQKPKICEYCGIDEETLEVLGEYWTGKNKNHRMSIDRIDNERPYELNNIVLACFTCNMMKGRHLTFDEMKIIGMNFLQPKWKALVEHFEVVELEKRRKGRKGTRKVYL